MSVKPRKFTDEELSLILSAHNPLYVPSRCCVRADADATWCNSAWPYYDKECLSVPYTHERLLQWLHKEGLS